jgi:hypothetical protein
MGVHVKAAAVLSDSPGFRFEASVTGRGGEDLLGHAGLPVLLGKKARVMLADDLLGGVALDPLHARIPAGDVPLRVEHVDRIVGDSIDEQAELLVGVTGAAQLPVPRVGQRGAQGTADEEDRGEDCTRGRSVESSAARGSRSRLVDLERQQRERGCNQKQCEPQRVLRMAVSHNR